MIMHSDSLIPWSHYSFAFNRYDNYEFACSSYQSQLHGCDVREVGKPCNVDPAELPPDLVVDIVPVAVVTSHALPVLEYHVLPVIIDVDIVLIVSILTLLLLALFSLIRPPHDQLPGRLHGVEGAVVEGQEAEVRVCGWG